MLHPDHRDILSGFIAEEVECLVVGAHALASHGIVRATGDIDLWVRRPQENASRIARALRRFGAPSGSCSAEDFTAPDLVIEIGVAPSRIDILTDIDGVGFPEAWTEHVEVDIEGLSVPVIGRKHLIRNKRATGRAQDLVDAERLEEESDH